MRPPYPAYRESGVACIGPIPEHWRVVHLGQIGSFSKGGGGTKADEAEHGFPCVRYGDLYTQHEFLIMKTRARIARDNAGPYTELEHGDLLFAGSGETIEEIGKSAVSLLVVMPTEVVDAAGGCVSDGGVVPVEIVGVHPGLEPSAPVGF